MATKPKTAAETTVAPKAHQASKGSPRKGGKGKGGAQKPRGQ